MQGVQLICVGLYKWVTDGESVGWDAVAGERVDSSRSIGHHHLLDRTARPDQRRVGTAVRHLG